MKQIMAERAAAAALAAANTNSNRKSATNLSGDNSGNNEPGSNFQSALATAVVVIGKHIYRTI